MNATRLGRRKIETMTNVSPKKPSLSIPRTSIWVQQLESHELVGRHWGQRRATSFHLLSVVEVLAGCLGGIVLSMVVAALPGVAGSQLAEASRSQGCM